MAYTAYLDTVQKVYIGYLQRPADPGGLLYWADQLDQKAGNLNEIIAAFAHCDESQTLYGTINSSNISTVVDSIYNALFGRSAEQAGLDFWVAGFNSGQFTPATIMLNILNGAQNEDRLSVENKLTAANLFTETIDPELDGRDFQYTYSGDADAQAGREWLALVTWDPWTIPTPDDIWEWFRSPTGQTFTLTAGADNITGTRGNDTINAPLSDSTMTFGSLDKIDGGAGTDTMTISINGTGEYWEEHSALTLSNVENIQAIFSGTGGILDLTNATGVSSVTVDAANPTNRAVVNGLAAGTALAIRNTEGDVTFNFVSGALSGSADEITLTVSGVNQPGTVYILIIDGPVHYYNGINLGNGIETLNVVSSGGVTNHINWLRVTSDTGETATISKIVITGDTGLSVDYPLESTVKTVDASAATGALFLNVGSTTTSTVTGGAGNDWIGGGPGNNVISGGAGDDHIYAGTGDNVISGGAGDDYIVAYAGNNVISGDAGNDYITILSAYFAGAGADNDSLSGGVGNDTFVLFGYLSSAGTIDGGDGTDTITASGTVSDDIFTNVTSVEVVKAAGSYLSASLNQTLAGKAVAAGITTVDLTNSASNDVVTFASGFTGSATVKLTGDSINNNANIVNNANITLNVVANASDIDATTTITGGTGTDTITLTADSGTGATTTAITGVESITVSAGTVGTETVTITMGANDTQIAAGKMLTVDATALTDSSATLTFTGTASETDGSLVIRGGAGADSITGGKFMDTITGGGGADTITITAGANKFLYDTFTDPTTGDILNTADQGTEDWSGGSAAAAKIVLGGTASFSDYLDAAAAGDGSTNGIYARFVYSGNTYVIEDVSAGSTFVSGTDLVIELVGVHDLTGSTVGDHIVTLAVA